MKQCPQCRRNYTDETLNFCLEDGSRLVGNSVDDFPTVNLLSRQFNEKEEPPTKQFLQISDSQNSAPSESVSPSIAVLPFVNISNDAENEYFCDGLAEELLNALAKIESLRVASRTSAFSFKDKKAEIREIGNALNVKTILEGSVRKSGNRLRITVQLINAANGFHLWSERYDREMKDIFEVQDEITLAVVDALKVKLFGEEKEAVLKRYTDNAEAYQLYLRGRFFWNKRTPEGFKKAIENFERAIEIDSDYALAYSGIADCYAFLGFHEAIPPAEAGQKARSAASRALELGGATAENYTSSGIILVMYQWDWAGSEKQYENAFKINPNYALAHHSHSAVFSAAGRFDEAIAAEKRAVEFEPLTPIFGATLAWWYYLAHKFTEAIEQSLKTIEIAPNHFFAHWILGLAYAQKAMYEEALAEFEKAMALSGNHQFVEAEIGRVYAERGETGKARKALEKLLEQSERQYISPCNTAKIHIGLGETEQALEQLEKARGERSVRLPWVIQDPICDSLRANPRYQDILRRIGLARQKQPVN